jgi:hypothetical protein
MMFPFTLPTTDTKSLTVDSMSVAGGLEGNQKLITDEAPPVNNSSDDSENRIKQRVPFNSAGIGATSSIGQSAMDFTHSTQAQVNTLDTTNMTEDAFPTVSPILGDVGMEVDSSVSILP